MQFAVGRWVFILRSPLSVRARAGKDWVCVNTACLNAYGSLRRLSDSDMGACKRCGKPLRRIVPPAAP